MDFAVRYAADLKIINAIMTVVKFADYRFYVWHLQYIFLPNTKSKLLT